MKVMISTGGKFHLFHLAEQLYKRGHLSRLITTYYNPWHNARGYEIDRTKIATNLIPEVVMRLPEKIPVIRSHFDGVYWKNVIFDGWASNHVNECDILVCLSGGGIRTIRTAKVRFDLITIVERPCSHMLYQKEILDEEYARWDLTQSPVDQRMVDRELMEYEECDYISIPSKFVFSTFVGKGVAPEKLIHVPYGVSLEHFRPVLKKDDTFRLVFVGQLSLRKGIPYLLQAFMELQLKNSELLLIGATAEEIKPFLKKYSGWYRYIGPISHWKLYQYYSQGSVLILPSIEEGLAYVQAQAMACGLPVICTTNTGGADIIRDGVDGFILPIRDVEALKEKILFLYEHQDICKDMGRSALDHIRRSRTWHIYGEHMCKIYQRILAGKLHRPRRRLQVRGH